MVARARPRRGILGDHVPGGSGQNGGGRIILDHRDQIGARQGVAARHPGDAPQEQDRRAKAAAADGAEHEHGLPPRDKQRRKPRQDPKRAKDRGLQASHRRPSKGHGA
jgi:hypothetical protein